MGVFSICEENFPEFRPSSPESHDPRQVVWPLQGSFLGCTLSGESFPAFCRSTFDCRYPMPRNVKCDFSELHGDDYLTAIDKFYIEVRNEYMADYHNITSAVILNELFKNKC